MRPASGSCAGPPPRFLGQAGEAAILKWSLAKKQFENPEFLKLSRKGLVD